MKQVKGFLLGVFLTLAISTYAQVDEALLLLVREIDQNVTTIMVELRTIKGILMP